MSNTPTLMQSEEKRLNELNSEPKKIKVDITCLLYTSPSPRDANASRMPSSA